MTEIEVEQFATKEEAIKAHPKLLYEYRDIKKAATAGFIYPAFIGALLVINNSEATAMMIFVALLFPIFFIVMSYLILQRYANAALYYTVIIVLGCLSMIHSELSEEHISFWSMLFGSLPYLIMFAMIQPAYSSIKVVNEKVENPIMETSHYHMLAMIVSMIFGLYVIFWVFGVFGAIGDILP